MKKYFVPTIIIAVMGLVFISCAKEKLIENSGAPSNEIALKSATISTKSAIEGTTFPDGYDMLVSAYRNKETGTTLADDDDSSNYFEDITFTKGTTSTWVAGTPKYWPLNGTLDFLCIASAGLKTATSGVVPVCVWDSDNVAKEVVATVPDNAGTFDDILYGSANGQTYTADGNAISFKHAECAVVFFSKSSVPYDATDNVGITITGITLNNPKTGGVLTVTNPKAGGNSTADDISASWDLSSGTTTTALKARVWSSTGNGIKTDEPDLTELHLSDEYTDEGANVPSPTTLYTNKFGDAYVILPPQNAVSFDINYTLHNGKDASGNALNNNLVYRYIPKADVDPGTAGNQPEVWEMGKKVVYLINITLHEIEISPEIIDWVNDFRTIEI